MSSNNDLNEEWEDGYFCGRSVGYTAGFEDGVKSGANKAIDNFVERINDIFKYRHDMNEIREIAAQIKEDMKTCINEY